MTNTFFLDADSDLSLQAQIRSNIIEAINDRVFAVGTRIPSSRKLSEELGVARNTVVLAYEQLIAEGYLVTRQRSGIFVNEDLSKVHVGIQNSPVAFSRPNIWSKRLTRKVHRTKTFSAPPSWQQYPYPFLEGQFDHSLYPVNEWREASRIALNKAHIQQWAGESGVADDPVLIEQIRTKVLPKRGIRAQSDEILVTLGTMHALNIVCELLIQPGTRVAVEEPGLPQVRDLVANRGGALCHQSLDDEGIMVDQALDQSDVIFVTPSHQTPTGITLSAKRRQALVEKANVLDQVIIEDDFEFESSYLARPQPAIKSLDTQGRVIYISCLSKVLSPGLRIGFMTAPKEFINEARRLLQLQVRHSPFNNQRTAALFLKLGHYDSFTLSLHRTFESRWIALRRAVNYYLLPYVEVTRSHGGSSLWLRIPDDIDPNYLVSEAAKVGVLIEPMQDYFATNQAQANFIRLGVTSIREEQIKAGIEALRDVLQKLTENKVETFTNCVGTHLSETELVALFNNVQMLCPVAYGDPCSIDIHGDGTLVGVAGNANEDCDQGRWWVEDGLWCRQWNRWAWGDVGRYRVVYVADAQVFKLFDEQGRLIDQGILRAISEADDRLSDEQQALANNWTKVSNQSGSTEPI